MLHCEDFRPRDRFGKVMLGLLVSLILVDICIFLGSPYLIPHANPKNYHGRTQLQSSGTTSWGDHHLP